MNRLILIFLILSLISFENKSFGQEIPDSALKEKKIEEKGWPIYETPPQFRGGADSLNKFIRLNLKKIDGAVGKRVFVMFVVEKDGSLTDIKVVRGINEEADKEALRVMKLSPKWKPGIQNGAAYRAQYSIPILFN